jgi:NTE family protein
MPIRSPEPRVAFVLGGGGVLGATQVGMLRALLEAGRRPSLVVGTSVGALNGAAIAADPSARGVAVLAELWSALSDSGMFSGSLLSQAGRLARHRTHLHSAAPLRRLLGENLPERIEDLAVPFQCVAASIERATAHWFSSGPLADAVLASCAVPGLLPPVEIDGEHFLDGGLVHSIPVGRALALGATEIYVLHVGRIERPLVPPKSPWDLGLVAFEIARRHRFVEEMSTLPPEVRAHVLPSGEDSAPLISLRYRSTADVASRVERGYQAAAAYLAGLPAAGAAGRPAADPAGLPAAGANGRPAGDASGRSGADVAGRPAAGEGGSR